MPELPARVFLSPPDIGTAERQWLARVLDENWIAPAGPYLNQFEDAVKSYTGSKHAVALSSGTAAIHLALQLCGVEAGDEVLCSTLTFIGSANPITYIGAHPVFIDSETKTWNMCPDLLAEVLASKKQQGKLPKALVLTHLYGEAAQLYRIVDLCEAYEVALIEDAAEALGTFYQGRHVGTFGRFGIFSFNGNKIITTSGGGMLVSSDEPAIERARYLASQAREPAVHYEHTECGYNYRMSAVLAAIGLGQLEGLEKKIAIRREHFARYARGLASIPHISFLPDDAANSRCTRWLTCCLVDTASSPVSPLQIVEALEAENIEARPLWKPLHMQPVFKTAEYWGRGVSDTLFKQGLCLPSGSGMSAQTCERVIDVIKHCFDND